EGRGWNRSAASHRQAPRRGHRHVVVGRPWHRTVDRGDVPDLSIASARRVAGWGLRGSQRLRARLRLEAATYAEGAAGPGRSLPALPHRGRLVLLESSQRTAKTAQMTGALVVGSTVTPPAVAPKRRSAGSTPAARPPRRVHFHHQRTAGRTPHAHAEPRDDARHANAHRPP